MSGAIIAFIALGIGLFILIIVIATTGRYQELADLLVLQLLDRGAASPLLPFVERGKILVPGVACHSLRAEVTFYYSPEGGCHEGSSCAAGTGFNADSSWPAALQCIMLP